MSFWYSPICDIALAKLEIWREGYERGEVHSTCKFNDISQGVIDKPTRYMHRLVWHPKEWEHLIRVAKAFSTNKPLIEELEAVGNTVLPRGPMVVGGARVVRLAFYPEHIDELISVMKQARDGVHKSLSEEIKEGGLF